MFSSWGLPAPLPLALPLISSVETCQFAMRFPLPDNLFPPVRVADDEAQGLQKLTEAIVHDAVEQFERFRGEQGRLVDDRVWKPVRARRGLSAYADRTLGDVAAVARAQAAAMKSSGINLSPGLPVGPVVGTMSLLSTKLHAVLVTGTVDGDLHDLLFGLHQTVSRDLQYIKSSYMLDKVADSKILAAIVDPTAEDPLRGFHLKWAVSELAPSFGAKLTRKVLHPRDFVYLDAIGTIKTAEGEELGYNVLHSLHIPGIRELNEFHIVRGNYSICSIFRQKNAGAVEVFMKGFVDVFGDLPTSLAIPGTARALMSYERGIYCGQMKKLNWILRNGRRRRDSENVNGGKRASCSGCGHSTTLGKPKTCQACGASICASCVATHSLSFLPRKAKAGKVVQRSVNFCLTCFRTAMSADAATIAANEISEHRDPRETFECSSTSERSLSQSFTAQSILSPSNSELPDVAREFFG